MLVIQQDFLIVCPPQMLGIQLTILYSTIHAKMTYDPWVASHSFSYGLGWLNSYHQTNDCSLSTVLCIGVSFSPKKCFLYLVRFSRLHLLSSGSQTWRTTAQLLYRSSWSYTPAIHYGVILKQSGSRNNSCDFKWQVTPRKWSCHGMGRSSTKSSARCFAALSARSGTKNKSKNEPVWMY